MRGTPEARFTAKVEVTSTRCWKWRGYLMPNGYGQFGADGVAVLAHRWAYEHWMGEVPQGLDLDHLCRNRWCVNPAHLEPVTRRENLRRGIRKTGQESCKNGHPLAGDNLKPTKDGRRQCRACQQAANRRYKLRRKTADEGTQPNPSRKRVLI